jgi:hypothetical protein
MLKRIFSVLVILAVLAFPFLAFAQVADPSEDLFGWAMALYAAFKEGAIPMVVALASVGVVAALRFLAAKTAWFSGDRRGAILALAVGVLGALARAIVIPGAGVVSVSSFVMAAVTPAGLFVLTKKILWPSDAA